MIRFTKLQQAMGIYDKAMRRASERWLIDKVAGDAWAQMAKAEFVKMIGPDVAKLIDWNYE